jgi:O-acetyl-ADP-ribose deacetylase (regulator of RNase III)
MAAGHQADINAGFGKNSQSRLNLFWRLPAMTIEVLKGDLLDQPVDAIVNAWNRNIFPWWLLVPQGVSGAIRRRAGSGPFRELAKMPMIPLGGAVVTGAGQLPHRAIIHVAGINLCWRSSEFAIRQSCLSALKIAGDHEFSSIAFPLIGAGTGGIGPDLSKNLMLQEFEKASYRGLIRLVEYT